MRDGSSFPSRLAAIASRWNFQVDFWHQVSTQSAWSSTFRDRRCSTTLMPSTSRLKIPGPHLEMIGSGSSRHSWKLHPAAHIVWIIREAYRELVDHNPHIDSVLGIRCVSQCVYLLRTRLFDRVYNLHLDGRVCGACRWPSLPNAETGVTVD